MPYKKQHHGIETAKSTGHVPIVQNEMVKERLRDYRVFTRENDHEIQPGLIVAADSLGQPGERVRWAMSFDGSSQEVAVKEKYPSTRIGYIQVAGVLVHLEEMLSQKEAHLVDPTVIHNATEHALHSIVMPGSNVCRPDSSSVRDSWRREIFDVFCNYTVEDVPLLDVFMLLISHSDKRAQNGGIVIARCASSDQCEARNIDIPSTGANCPRCGQPLYPTDSLRIHEEVSEEHGNSTALGRLMTVMEHVTMVAYTNYLLQRRPQALGCVALIMDGPLALFGPQAWLHGAILSFIQSTKVTLERNQFKMPLIIGIEKGGQFAEHCNAISERIPERSLMVLPDDYIYNHIITFRTSPQSTFGRDTYYGQKYFYKTGQGKALTITIPKISDSVPDPHNPIHYSVLPDTLALLDLIGTSLYVDAVIPVALAHSFASIPLRTGSKVLTLLSRELLGQNSNGQ